MTEKTDHQLPCIPVEKTTEARNNLLFEEQETLNRHTPYAVEKLGLACVRSGDTKRLEALMVRLAGQTVIAGNMSRDPLRQAKYVVCCTMSMCTRAAIDGGLPETVALCFSDETILAVDEMTEPDEIYLALAQAVYRLTEMVRDGAASSGCSEPVRVCVNYIQEHLHSQISLDELAREAGVSRSHLCRLFRADTGQSPSQYVLRAKLAEAHTLLTESGFSISEVANVLDFSSQSYFSACFKKRYGITPNAFRREL